MVAGSLQREYLVTEHATIGSSVVAEPAAEYSFAPADTRIRAREVAAARRAERKADEFAERKAAMDDRMTERRQKEAATMDM